jgi:HEAT repeat protein
MLRVSGPDLAAMIGAVDPAQRYAALRVIARVFDRRPEDGPVEQSVGDAVISALNEKDAPMRLAAMQALGVMRYERAVQGLLDLFQYFGKGELAEVALDAVARVAHPSSTPQLLPLLTSKDPALRGIAVEGLARIGDRTKLPEIQGALRGERNDSLVLAGNFAALLLASGGTDPVGLLGPLVAALDRPRLRDQARGYLTEAAPGRAQLFARYLAEPDASARVDLLDVLGLGGDSAAIAVVDAASGDRDPRVARAAERALARLRQLRAGG